MLRERVSFLSLITFEYRIEVSIIRLMFRVRYLVFYIIICLLSVILGICNLGNLSPHCFLVSHATCVIYFTNAYCDDAKTMFCTALYLNNFDVKIKL